MSSSALAAVGGATLIGVAARFASAQTLEPTLEPSMDGGVRAVAAGSVTRVTSDGDRPVPRTWVIVHRVDSAGGAALDSARTDARGRFRVPYVRSLSPPATYFLTATHHGVAYVSTPLSAGATETETTLAVFDTSSAPVLDVLGRNILVFARDGNGRHQVVEAYTVSNDTIVTRVGSTGLPVWTALLPTGAEDLGPGPPPLGCDPVRLMDGVVAAIAPFAPGSKRYCFTYFLATEALPVSYPMVVAVPSIEVMIEGPGGSAVGGSLVEAGPMSFEGRTFRRFRADNVPASTVIVIDIAQAPNASPVSPTLILGLLTAVMLIAVSVAHGRRMASARANSRRISSDLSVVPPAERVDAEADALARRIAELDAEFDRHPVHSGEARANYEAARADLKRRLSERLALRAGG